MKTVRDLNELPQRVDGNLTSLWGTTWIITREIRMVDGERTPTARTPLKGCGAYCDGKKYPPATAEGSMKSLLAASQRGDQK